MFFFLTEATKQLIVRELRGYWATHPRYRDLVDNIQGKYSFSTRLAMVDLPAPDRPVNQSVAGFWFFRLACASRVMSVACQCTF
jgi:hypothetical protein